MAVVIFSGLISSTLLDTFLTPAMFWLFGRKPAERLMDDKDVEALSWFVRSGGYLFGSCWALHETIEKIYPGLVRKYETRGAQVIDYRAIGTPCVPDSPYLEGVFDPFSRPMYALEGAHLIETLDRDRVEVLVDSPGSATSWGSGDMAAWFTAGHGVILDSVNHFQEQGFKQGIAANGLKTTEAVHDVLPIAPAIEPRASLVAALVEAAAR